MTDPYYTFYPGDYQRDTQDLSLMEHGAYRLLLDYYYSNGYLPNDEKRLYRICRAKNYKERQKVLLVKERFWFPSKDSKTLLNKRAKKELEKRDKYRELQREKAKRRWDKSDAGADAGADAAAEPVQMPGLCKPSPSLTTKVVNTNSSSSFNASTKEQQKPKITKKSKQIFEELKLLASQIEGIYKNWNPWEAIQKAINEGYLVEDIEPALKYMSENKANNPWACFNSITKKEKHSRLVKQREQEWLTKKIEETQDVARLIKGIGEPIE